MDEREASRLLLDLHLRHHESKAEIAQLDRSGVTAARILALYPLDVREWASSLDAWLADVPPGALENIHHPVPLDAREWGRLERGEGWAIYRSSATFERHQQVAELLFPQYNFSVEIFLQDMFTALWYLQHWSGSVEAMEARTTSVKALAKYVRSWATELMNPAENGRDRLSRMSFDVR